MEEEAEDIWNGEEPGGEEPGEEEILPAAEEAPPPESEPAPESDSQPTATPEAAAEAGSPAGPPSGAADEGGQPAASEESLLGERAAKLFEYLKGLSEELPEEKRNEFEESGLREKLDGLIGKLAPEAEEEGGAEAGPETAGQGAAGPVSEGGPSGLLATAAAARPHDPRRAPEGRRSGRERRAPQSNRRSGEPDRRRLGDRRQADDRRAELDRRSEPPKLELPESIPPEAAPVRTSPEGRPLEIAGLPVSPRIARLIEIMRREKENAGKR